MPVVLNNSLLGSRVVLRYRRTERDAGPPLTDVVGELIALDPANATVRGRRGEVVISLADVVAAKPVAPDRRMVLELERIAGRGWRAAEEARLDGWLLRANSGWTSRGNSVLPLATPHRPLPELLAAVEDFYASRGLPSMIHVPMPARGLLDAELAGRGWQASESVLVMTKRLTEQPTQNQPEAAADLVLATEPTKIWQDGYHARDGVLSDAALGLLRRHENVRFAALIGSLDPLDPAIGTIAIGRGVVDESWLGISMVEVAAEHRRQGLASRVMASLESWGANASAARAYLQVSESNVSAIQTYWRLGYTEHHRYHCRTPAA
jgi:ribosomal protein S18 acetylase RimI-like enzyme